MNCLPDLVSSEVITRPQTATGITCLISGSCQLLFSLTFRAILIISYNAIAVHFESVKSALIAPDGVNRIHKTFTSWAQHKIVAILRTTIHCRTFFQSRGSNQQITWCRTCDKLLPKPVMTQARWTVASRKQPCEMHFHYENKVKFLV